MKVFVTGAAGFIGSHVCLRLAEDGHNVVGIDNFNDYYSPILKRHRSNESAKHGIEVIEGDIENLEVLDGIFAQNGFDAVINLGARAGVRYSTKNPHVYMKTNGHGNLNLLECCRKHGVGKFVLASTSSLYAGQSAPFDEANPTVRPLSPYAASKLAAESMAFSYHHLYGLDVSILRYFTVYGPSGRPDMAVFRFIESILSGTPITLYGDGKQSRDFTYVTDIADGTVAALRPVGYELFNLGGGQTPVPMNDVIEMLERHTGEKAKIEYKPFHDADMHVTHAKNQKAEKILSWSPKVSLDEGLNETVAWHLSSRNLFQEMDSTPLSATSLRS
ncbi:UDP-glucose 4-epimerase [Crateriforma conspicua]|nr:UDP-glucose 4-epimerase [Crateriforma conspicua]